MRPRRRIGLVLLLAMLEAAGVPVLGFLVLEESVVQSMVRRYEVERARETARAVARSASMYLDRATGSLAELARAADLLAEPDTRRTLAEATRSALPALESLAFLDASGRVELVEPARAAVQGLRLDDAPALRSLAPGAAFGVSPAFASRVSGSPAVSIVLRRRSGFLLADLRLEGLAPFAVDAAEGTGFEARILDAAGVVVAGPVPEEVATRMNLRNELAAVGAARPGDFAWFARGGAEVAALASPLEGFGWNVLVSRDAASFRALSTAIRATFLLTGLALSAIAALVAAGLSRRLRGPIVSLAGYAAARGPRPALATDILEFEELGRDLSRMIEAAEEREASLRAALDQRDLLLREVHHRVKNNLQIVASLLSLQRAGLSDTVAGKALEEGGSRVQALALVHEKLYESSELDRVDLGSYARDLAGTILDAYEERGEVEILVEAGGLSLVADQAVPFGLLLGEILSNAAKYAYPQGRRGRFSLRAEEAEGRILVTAGDDGPGFDPARPLRADSLGLTLIASLARQLGGEARLGPGPGATWLLEFPAAGRAGVGRAG